MNLKIGLLLRVILSNASGVSVYSDSTVSNWGGNL
jgi:hypothetical protein